MAGHFHLEGGVRGCQRAFAALLDMASRDATELGAAVLAKPVGATPAAEARHGTAIAAKLAQPSKRDCQRMFNPVR